jgi:4-hydroxy-tetrahydrodipicolinate synthase
MGKEMISTIKKQFLKNVKGPVFPIPTPFTYEGDVDYDSLEKYVDFLVRSDAQIIMVTVGTSRFDILTVNEMMEVNEHVVKTVAGRAVTIVTTPTNGPTSQAEEFVQHAQSIKADGILAVYPDRYYSDDSVYQFFESISKSDSIGVLIHEKPIRSGRAGIGPYVHYSPGLVEEIATIENVVGMKEECCQPELAYKFNTLLRDKFLIIGGGGGMREYLTAHQWGQPAYLVSIGNFAPKIELDFFEALTNTDYDKAELMVLEKEVPFFETAVKVGWHLALKEALEFIGLMKAWERSPLVRLSEDERNSIRKVMSMYI